MGAQQTESARPGLTLRFPIGRRMAPQRDVGPQGHLGRVLPLVLFGARRNYFLFRQPIERSFLASRPSSDRGICYNFDMPSSRESDSLQMNTDLRIPVTSEQEKLIREASENEPEGMAAWARAVLLHAARTKVGSRGTANAQEFSELVHQWKAERNAISTARRMADHPAYRKIIDMGVDAIPLILQELEKEPDHWFIALHERAPS
jgi:hypothetical protein